MGVTPWHGHELRAARLEERVAVSVDSVSLLCPNDVGGYALLIDGVVLRKSVLVEEGQEASEGIGLALVGRGRQQQQVR